MRLSRTTPVLLLAVASGASLVAMSERPGTVEDVISPAALERARAALPAADSGNFRIVTYNVAGLPDFLSGSRPSANIPRMGPLLSGYDIVLAQEDFSYTEELRAGIRLPFQFEPTRTGGLLGIGDGLNRFSRLPFATVRRERWWDCHGHFANRSDCLAAKGFSVATHYIGREAVLDVYNVHMDAGKSPADQRARIAQVWQLLTALREYSAGRAVIIAGDTNLQPVDEAAVMHLMHAGGLRDACEVSGGTTAHGGVDKVLYRSSADLELIPVDWRTDRRFVDGTGKPLSDHQPVAVEFRWEST